MFYIEKACEDAHSANHVGLVARYRSMSRFRLPWHLGNVASCIVDSILRKVVIGGLCDTQGLTVGGGRVEERSERGSAGNTKRHVARQNPRDRVLLATHSRVSSRSQRSDAED